MIASWLRPALCSTSAVHDVLERIRAAASGPPQQPSGPPAAGTDRPRDPFAFTDDAFPIAPEQGDLATCWPERPAPPGSQRAPPRSASPPSIWRRPCTTTAAVWSSPRRPWQAKAERARRSFEEAGLGSLVELRVAVTPERRSPDLGGPIDLFLVDGWPTGSTPSLARSIIELVTPELRPRAIVMNDNGEADYLAYMRHPASGFPTLSLALKGATELSVRLTGERRGRLTSPGAHRARRAPPRRARRAGRLGRRRARPDHRR